MVASYIDTDSVYAWKKRNKLGQFAEKDAEAEKAQAEEEERQKELAGGMKVGDRCEVRAKEGADAKRGTVMFVGECTSHVRDVCTHAHTHTTHTHTRTHTHCKCYIEWCSPCMCAQERWSSDQVGGWVLSTMNHLGRTMGGERVCVWLHVCVHCLCVHACKHIGDVCFYFTVSEGRGISNVHRSMVALCGHLVSQ